MAQLRSLDLDSVFRRLRRNIGLLMTGSGMVALLGMGTLAFNARALTPAELGVLALLEALVLLLAQVFSFDTPQGIIRFGTRALEEQRTDDFRAITALALWLDGFSSIAAAIATVILVLGFGAAIGLPERLLLPSCAFAATLLVQFPGTPVGILRVLDQFKWVTWVSVTQATLKLCVAAVLFTLDAPVEYYIYGYAASLFAANLLRLALAVTQLRRAAGPLRIGRGAGMRSHARPFLRFSTGSWLAATLRIVRQQGTVFIIAGLLGPAGAGHFAVAQRIVLPIGYLAELLRQAVYPELARLAAAGRHADVVRLVKRTVRLTGSGALVFTLLTIALGHWMIAVVAGAGYESAYWLLVELSVAHALFLCAPFINDLVILYAGIGRLLSVITSLTVVWAITSPGAIYLLGLDGAGIGQVVFTAILMGVSAWIFFTHHKRTVQSAPAPAPAPLSEQD